MGSWRKAANSRMCKNGSDIHDRLDLLIAAHALSLDATLVTNNQTHFARISGLQVANWLQHT